jgi:hypothetical protein
MVGTPARGVGDVERSLPITESDRGFRAFEGTEDEIGGLVSNISWGQADRTGGTGGGLKSTQT